MYDFTDCSIREYCIILLTVLLESIVRVLVIV